LWHRSGWLLGGKGLRPSWSHLLNGIATRPDDVLIGRPLVIMPLQALQPVLSAGLRRYMQWQVPSAAFRSLLLLCWQLAGGHHIPETEGWRRGCGSVTPVEPTSEDDFFPFPQHGLIDHCLQPLDLNSQRAGPTTASDRYLDNPCEGETPALPRLHIVHTLCGWTLALLRWPLAWFAWPVPGQLRFHASPLLPCGEGDWTGPWSRRARGQRRDKVPRRFRGQGPPTSKGAVAIPGRSILNRRAKPTFTFQRLQLSQSCPRAGRSVHFSLPRARETHVGSRNCFYSLLDARSPRARWEENPTCRKTASDSRGGKSNRGAPWPSRRVAPPPPTAAASLTLKRLRCLDGD
jgi:hypothetical protein